MKLSVDIKNAQGGYPYKYKRTPMNRLKRWEREAAKLEADLEERTKQFHLAETKVMSREAIIEQLSETELAKDVTRLEAENEALIEIKRVAKLYLEYGEPELADELDALFKETD